MALENITQVTNFFDQLSLGEASVILQPLIVFIIGMVIYSIFVFKFYKFISRKDIFRVSKGGHTSALRKFGYVLEYIFLFPIIAFIWFFVLSILLTLISQFLTIGNIFMVSMATLATIRVTAYYHEDLSRDIAKLIPFAMLAIFLLELTPLSTEIPLQVIYQIVSSTKILVYYFIFIVVLEFLLRIITYRRTPSEPQKTV